MFKDNSVSHTKEAHIIVIGNEKGGTGKSTLTMHIMTSLLKAGQSVASIDLDSRQGSLTRYIENRKRAAKKYQIQLETPLHFAIQRSAGRQSLANNETIEFNAFSKALNEAQEWAQFIIIDTPAADTYLSRLAHSMADTLVTPLNDSFIDFDVLGKVDPESYEILSLSHYAQIVADSRRQRRMIDNQAMDWILVRNRLSMLSTHNNRNVTTGLQALAQKLGFRVADGISERVIFREFFPNGLTALDPLDEIVGEHRPSMTNIAARQEIRKLMECLALPIDNGKKTRKDNKQIWSQTANSVIHMHDIFDTSTELQYADTGHKKHYHIPDNANI